MAVFVVPRAVELPRADGRRGRSMPHCGSEWFHPKTTNSDRHTLECAKSGARLFFYFCNVILENGLRL